MGVEASIPVFLRLKPAYGHFLSSLKSAYGFLRRGEAGIGGVEASFEID